MQRTYPQYYDIAVAGLISGQGTPKVLSLRNAASTQPQVFNIAPSGGGSGAATYSATVSIPGVSAPDNTISFGYTAAHSLAQVLADLSLNLNRQGKIFEKAFAGSNSTSVALRARGVGNHSFATALAVANTGSGSATFTTTTTPASSSGEIEYGVFVGQNPGDQWNMGRLPTGPETKIRGVTHLNYAEEKIGMGPDARIVYRPDDAMDVVQDTETNEGIWVRTDSPTIGMNDEVRVSYAPATRGWATKSTTSSSVVSKAEYARPAITTSDGKTIVMVKLTK